MSDDVEKMLKKDPLKVKGFGLQKDFHDLFDKKESVINLKNTKRAMEQGVQAREISI